MYLQNIQWNPSCEATPFAPEKWPFKRGGLLSGVEINTFMFRFTLSSGLSRGGGLSSGWPLKRGSTVDDIFNFQKYPLHSYLQFLYLPIKFRCQQRRLVFSFLTVSRNHYGLTYIVCI